MKTASKLGYSEQDRLLIVNADDFGMCHSFNIGVKQLLEEGVISSTTLMMPCPWAKEAAVWSAAHPIYDVGIHLTLTSEWKFYKWGPVSRNSDTTSLITAEGYFPADCLTVEQQADTTQVRTEIISQIELAKLFGVNPTHLDNHMGSVYGLQTGRHFLETVLDICMEYQLPFRMPRSAFGMDLPPQMEIIMDVLAELADSRGVFILDYLLGLPFQTEVSQTYEEVRADMASLLRSMRPGISEIIIHPSPATDELKAVMPHWERRAMEFELFRDPYLQKVIKEEGIQMIRWKDLQEAQRAAMK
ncbi:MAG: polysaccharide deacetylase family protein [Gorillibacterium sp.]|nr:polysaccharide deacetylase family protein [Gorillibacterium sp.]